MSTNITNKISIECVANVKNSDYKFNRFDKLALCDSASVLKISALSESYSEWKGVSADVFGIIDEKFLQNGYEIYCFIASPYWQENTRIARHYGLRRLLSKKYGTGPLEFVFEEEIVDGNYICFYGIIKLSLTNSRILFNLLSAHENGVLFSWIGDRHLNFKLLIDDLAKIVRKSSNTTTFNINIVDAINLILSKGSKAIFPYAWNETGQYQVDIFESGV
jgi:hypothetical protein